MELKISPSKKIVNFHSLGDTVLMRQNIGLNQIVLLQKILHRGQIFPVLIRAQERLHL